MKLMPSASHLLVHSLFVLCVAATGTAGCSSDVDLGSRPATGQTCGTGGDPGSTATGGSTDNHDEGSGGFPTATGGSPSATGGDVNGTGGSPSTTGGSGGSDNHDEGSGGFPAATGGSPDMTGGSANAVGGGPMTSSGEAASGGPATGVCGDGVVNAGEACDDGNTVGGDGCSAECTVEIGWRCDPPGTPCINFPNCGDGIVDDGEACDDGLRNDGHYGGCNTDCTLAPHCGDGVIQTDHEQCDPGMNVAGNGCTADCQLG